MLYTRPLAALIGELQKLPGIGPKSAQRLAFHLLRQDTTEIRRLADALVEAKERIRACSTCCNLSAEDPCELCLAPGRDDAVLCVVAEPRDLVALEKTREFKGRYHVLGGLISPMDGVGPDQLKVAEMLGRLGQGHITEVILALNPTVEGEATTLYLSRLLKPAGIRVTRLAFGLPMGTDLDFADEVTLARALEGRREL